MEGIWIPSLYMKLLLQVICKKHEVENNVVLS